VTSPQALVCAPRGRDATVAGALLRAVGVAARQCADLAACVAALHDDMGFALLAEEATHSADLGPLAAWVAAQPEWSDFPFIVLTERTGAPERNPQTGRLVEVLGNVTFLERPFHPTTFASMVRTVLTGRRRQYEARARIAELRRLNETLEERVAERARELESAHHRTLAEIAQRQRAEEQLRQSQKLELVGQLTGGVAHDFNNLLMAVIGNLDLLRKHLAGDARALHFVEGALQGAQRGAALTQRLLAFARRQDLRVEPRSLTELVGGMTALLERSVGPAIELRFELAAGLPPALVDANQIELALLNLAVNSRDAMPEGGLLSIAVDRARDDGAADLAPGDYLRLRVSDSGHGMDAATLKKATEPFFSTKELGKGTGLGLSMIQGLAVQLNGALRLSSQVGVGTVAELWLPVAPVDARSPRDVAGAAPATAPLERITILLVDDDALIAMSAADMLEDLGHEVLQAASGSRALEVLRGQRRIDLLLTDYAMPKMTGAELAVAARALRPELPILLVTGYAELPAGSGPELPRLGKPYQQEQLAAAVARVLGPRARAIG
jgi:signal transduction histidine kinase/CheY-like chemotaxis protein